MTTSEPPPEITFVVDGPVGEEARLHAEEEMRRLAAKAPRPVLFARVKLLEEPQRPDPERAIAQGTLDVSGVILRAEAAAANPIEATNLLADKLDRRMRRLRERRETARERPPSSGPGQWRHGDLPEARPGFFPRPAEERRIVRRKSFAPGATSIEEAIFDLEILDHRFFLFTDQSDGTDAVVYESGDEVRLQRIDGDDPPVERPVPAVVERTPAPALSEEQAVQHLNLSDEPFVFFRDPGSGRGRVLYRRYDGHYGLVEPRA